MADSARRSFMETVFSRRGVGEMTYKESVTLSPWQKFRKFGKFPAKIILHLLLFIFLVTQTYMMFHQFSEYYRECRLALQAGFIPSTYIAAGGLFSVADVMNLVNFTVQQYYNFPRIAIDTFVPDYEDGAPVPLSMRLYDSSLTGVYNLTQASPLGPFAGLNATQIRSICDDLSAMDFKFYYTNTNDGPFGTSKVRWEVYGHTGFSSAGAALYTLRESSYAEINPRDFVWLFAFDAVVLLLASLSGLLTLRSLVRTIRLYFDTRKYFQQIPSATLNSYRYQTWSAIPVRIKLEFFSFWSITSLLASLLLVISTIYNLATRHSDASTTMFILHTLGTAVICASLVRYLEYNAKFYTLIMTLKLAFARVVRCIISITPLFFGYVIAGVVLFAPYSAITAVTLFGLLNGDNIMAVFADLQVNYPHLLISRLYLYTFIGVFITAILNIFIFIIEDAFDASKNLGKDPKEVKRKRATRLDLKGLFDILQKELGADESNPSNNNSKAPKFSNDFKRSAVLTGAYNLASSADKGKARDGPAKSSVGAAPSAAAAATAPPAAGSGPVRQGSNTSTIEPLLSPRSGGSGARAAQIQQILQAQQRAFAEQLNQETERLRGIYMRRLQDTLQELADGGGPQAAGAAAGVGLGTSTTSIVLGD